MPRWTTQFAKGQQIYALIARGYKAGGFNLSQGLPANQILFGPGIRSEL